MAPPDGERDILCVAGGTGLAPLKAIVEQVIASGRRTNISMIVGARRAAELYDLPRPAPNGVGLYPWLSVLPVVVAGRLVHGNGEVTLDEVVPERINAWNGNEVCKCVDRPPW